MFELVLPIREKIRRADTYIEELNDVISEFIQRQPYRVVAEYHYEVHQVWARLQAKEALPTARLGVIVSDVVHNLRSALDQLVWALTIHHQRRAPREPVGKRCWWRNVQFPICRYESDWRSEETRRLQGIRSDLRRLIKEEQPFASGQDPDRHPLWVLQELWNRDKHRAVPLVAGATIGFRPPHPYRQLLMAIFGQPYLTRLPTQALVKSQRPVHDGDVLVVFETSEELPIEEKGC